MDGRQRSLGKKKNAAWDRYRQLIADRDAGKTTKDWTVRQCLDHYLDHARSMKPNTYRNREQVFARSCEEARVGVLPWRNLTVDHLEAWLRLHPGWSASMRRSVINYVMAAFNYCVGRKKIGENPIHGVRKRRWERRRENLSPVDERKVFEARKGPSRAILTVLRATGARPNELCSA